MTLGDIRMSEFQSPRDRLAHRFASRLVRRWIRIGDEGLAKHLPGSGRFTPKRVQQKGNLN
jgi:hypothetical protein